MDSCYAHENCPKIVNKLISFLFSFNIKLLSRELRKVAMVLQCYPLIFKMQVINWTWVFSLGHSEYEGTVNLNMVFGSKGLYVGI